MWICARTFLSYWRLRTILYVSIVKLRAELKALLDEGSGSGKVVSALDEGVGEKVCVSKLSGFDASLSRLRRTTDFVNTCRKIELLPCSNRAPIFEIASHAPCSCQRMPERVM